MYLMTKAGEYSAPLQDQRNNNGASAPILDWRGMQPSDHFVQFYESDVALVDSVSDFIGAGLDKGEVCLVIATRAHREALEERLKAYGIDLAAARTQGLYVS